MFLAFLAKCVKFVKYVQICVKYVSNMSVSMKSSSLLILFPESTRRGVRHGQRYPGRLIQYMTRPGTPDWPNPHCFVYGTGHRDTPGPPTPRYTMYAPLAPLGTPRPATCSQPCTCNATFGHIWPYSGHIWPQFQ